MLPFIDRRVLGQPMCSWEGLAWLACQSLRFYGQVLEKSAQYLPLSPALVLSGDEVWGDGLLWAKGELGCRLAKSEETL